MAPPPMPARNSKDAPSFKTENPADIELFFFDFNEACMVRELPDAEKYKQVIRYIDQKARALWVELKSYGVVGSWKEFETEVIGNYIADTKNRYSLRDAENIVERTTEFTSTEEFLQYHRDITQVIRFLEREKKISEEEGTRIYFSGFKGQLREDLIRRLMIILPDVHMGGPYDIAQVRTSTIFLLTGTSQGVRPTSNPGRFERSSPAPRIKAEDDLQATVRELKESMATMRAMLTRPVSNGYQGDQSNRTNGQPVTCIYCRETGHFRRNCPSLIQDMRDNLVRQNPDTNRVVMADGSEIAGPNTMSLKDRVRSQTRGALNRDAPPHMGSSSAAPVMMLRAKSFMQASKSSDKLKTLQPAAYIEEVTEGQTNDDEGAYAIAEAESMLLRHVEERRKADEELQRAEDYLAELRSGKKVRFAGVEVPIMRAKPAEKPPVNVDPAIPAAKPSKSKPAQNGNTDGPTATTAHTPTSQPADKANDRFEAPKDGSKMGGDKNFRFQTPIELENSHASEGILSKLLSENITVSVADLLAACPDVRRQLKDKCSNKRVPRQDTHISRAIQVYMQHHYELRIPPDMPTFGVTEDGQSAAMDRYGLRTIRVNLDRLGPLQAVLDSGSSFIAIPYRVAFALGRPFRSDMALAMVTADGKEHFTMGVIPEVVLQVGPVKLTVPIQVTTDGSFDILLGRPFFAHTRCVTKDKEDGSQTITITDPRKGSQYTIPTGVLDDDENMFKVSGF